MGEFIEKLTIANKYEKWIGSFMNNVEKYNDDKLYDILLTNGLTIEIKQDFQTYTGNIAIEYWCRDKPSGISTTEADYHIFIFPLLDEVWKIKTSKLKDLIKLYQDGLYIEHNETSELFYIDNAAGGDDDNTGEGRSKLRLMKRSDVIKYFDVNRMVVPIFKKDD